MILKEYKQNGTGFFGQDDRSWGEAWKGVSDLARLLDSDADDHLAPFFNRYFPLPPARILEAGCGVGRYVAAYRRLGYDITGVEFSAATVRAVKAVDAALPIDIGDIVALPYADGAFDCYFSGGVIEHFEEGPDAPLREAHRVLKRGGTLIATVPYVNLLRRAGHLMSRTRTNHNLTIRRCDACERQDAVPDGAAFSEYYFDAASLRPFLERNGFAIEMVAPVDFLWGEIGTRLVGVAKRLRGRPWNATTSVYDQPSTTVLGRGAEAGHRSLLYDFLVKENWERPGFKAPLRLLNYLSGHMLLVVARAV